MLGIVHTILTPAARIRPQGILSFLSIAQPLVMSAITEPRIKDFHCSSICSIRLKADAFRSRNLDRFRTRRMSLPYRHRGGVLVLRLVATILFETKRRRAMAEALVGDARSATNKRPGCAIILSVEHKAMGPFPDRSIATQRRKTAGPDVSNCIEHKSKNLQTIYDTKTMTIRK